MTRFARARGSKSSNKREPEEATSWSQLKAGLYNKPNSSLADKTQEIQKFKETLKDLEQDKSVVWSTFDEFSSGVKVENSEVKKKKKKLKADKKEEANDNEISEIKVSKKRKIETPETIEQVDNTLKTKPKKKKKKNLIPNKMHENVEILSKHRTEKDAKESQKEKVDELEKNTNFENNETVKKKKKNKNKIPKPDSKQETKTSQTGETNVPQFGSNPTNQNKTSTFPPSKNNKKLKKDFKSRRKPLPQPYQIDINGDLVDVVSYDGFPIMLEDAKRLDELKKSLYAKGISHAEIKSIMKQQRRSAEKSLARAKKKVCFNCRKSGHNLSECPALNQGEGTGICFKCGSTEHTHFECKVVKKQDYKFAQCFICKEQGHISNQCPDNPRGLYPKGGACKLCGDVTHLKRFCPTLPKDSEPTIDNFLEEVDQKKVVGNKPKVTPNKVVRF